MRRLARAVTAAMLILSVPAVAGAVAYKRFNQEWWTGSTSTGPAAAAPARDEALPQPSPQGAPDPAPRATRHPWPAGSCVTAAAVRTDCTSGALRVVASLHTHRGTPCRDVPETTVVRRAGAYTLCLATL